MGFRNSAAGFGVVAKALHWTMAAMLIGMLALGVYMHELPLSPEKFELYALHKSIGVTVLALALFRLGWRMFDRPPAPVASIPPEQAKLAAAAHWALYFCMVAMPITGWCMAAASGTPVDLFDTGLLLPNPVSADDDLRIAFRILHDMVGKLLMALIVIHLGAALKHHFHDKDATLRRMLPFGIRKGRGGANGLT